MKTIVFSGVNLVSGGTLSIYKNCLNALLENGLHKKYNIIALVHSKDLFNEFSDYIDLVEFPKAKKSWLNRIYYEYIYFYFWSKKRNIDFWFSIHDMTPNVKAQKRAVYCHNATPFYKMPISKIKYGWKEFLFSKFYKFLYRINIRKNDYVIVQQDWIRTEFKKLYNIDNIIVARPSFNSNDFSNKKSTTTKSDVHTFIFPSIPRLFKNFEVVCEATKILSESTINKFRVILTIDGTETKYSRELVEKYKSIDNIKFVGILKRNELFDLYAKVDTMIFPSYLETWGLPITEFKIFEKPIILADLPYAYETIGTYDKACFFNPNSPLELAKLMKNDINHINIYKPIKQKPVAPQYSNNWKELFSILFKV